MEETAELPSPPVKKLASDIVVIAEAAGAGAGAEDHLLVQEVLRWIKDVWLSERTKGLACYSTCY